MTAAIPFTTPLPFYLDNFPLPDQAPYSIAVDMGIVRSPMAAGNVRQRRLYDNMPQLFSLQFHMHTAELWVWQTWVNETAYNWFYLPLASMYAGDGQGLPGGMLSYHIARFTSDLAVTLEGYDWYSVTVAAEISPQMFATAPRPPGLDRIDALGPGDDVGNVIDGGVPFRLSMDGPIDGGGPLVIQQTQLAALIGGTVALEATLSAVSPVAMAADLTGTASLDATIVVLQVLLAAQLTGNGSLAATVSIAGSRELAAALSGTGTLGAAMTVTPAPTLLAANLSGTGTLGAALTITAPPLDVDAAAYIAAMTVQPDATRQGVINALVTGLKTDGLWTKIDWLLLCLSHDAQAALVNAKTPTKIATIVGTLPFTTDWGYQGPNASNANYIDIGEVFNASGNVYSQNSAFLLAYTAGPGGGTDELIGTVSTGGNVDMSVTSLQINQTGSNANNITGSKPGMRIASRTGATAGEYYRDGVAKLGGVLNTSAAVPAAHGALLRDTNGTANSNRMMVFASGSSLNATQAANLRNRILAYTTAVLGVTDTDTASYIASMDVKPSAARSTLLDSLIDGLKTDGLWPKLDWLALFAAHAEQAGRVNVKYPWKAISASFGTMTFTVDRGQASDSTGALWTNEKLVGTAGNVYAQNSAFVMTYINSSSGATTNEAANGNDNTMLIQAGINGGNELHNLNDANATTIVSTGKNGGRIISRTSSSNFAVYKNGALVSTLTAASKAYVSGSAQFFRGSSGNASHSQQAAVALGSGLSATDASNLHNRVLAYLTAIGAN
jgi:hypothetical protein